mgnify:CR=1 FL=1
MKRPFLRLASWLRAATAGLWIRHNGLSLSRLATLRYRLLVLISGIVGDLEELLYPSSYPHTEHRICYYCSRALHETTCIAVGEAGVGTVPCCERCGEDRKKHSYYL